MHIKLDSKVDSRRTKDNSGEQTGHSWWKQRAAKNPGAGQWQNQNPAQVRVAAAWLIHGLEQSASDHSTNPGSPVYVVI